MITFAYQARDASGRIVSGIQDALNEDKSQIITACHAEASPSFSFVHFPLTHHLPRRLDHLPGGFPARRVVSFLLFEPVLITMERLGRAT